MHSPFLPLTPVWTPSHHPRRPLHSSVAKGKWAEGWIPPWLPGWLQTKEMYSRHWGGHVQAGNVYVFFEDVHIYINLNSQIQVTKCAPQMLQAEKKTVVLLGLSVSWLHKKIDLINPKGKVEKCKSRISIPMPRVFLIETNYSLIARKNHFKKLASAISTVHSALMIILDPRVARGCIFSTPASS